MKKKYIVLIIIAVILISIRIALPGIAKKHINKQLNNIEGYHAYIEDVDIHLYRGAFQIYGLHIIEEASADTTIPMVHLPLLDLSIEWTALFEKRIVGHVFMDSPHLNLTKPAAGEEEKVSEYRIAFFESVQELNPIEINTFEVINARLAYRDPTASPEIDVALESLNIMARNLGNVQNPDVALPASIALNATAMGNGVLNIDGRLNLLKATPDFDINFKLEKAQIRDFNNLTEHHVNLKTESGLLYFYLEAAAVDGKITGYVKPVIEGLEIENDKEDPFPQRVYQGAAQVVTNVFENKKEEQIATRIEIAGDLDNPDTNTFQALINIFRNAFIEAYSRELDYVINFGGEAEK
jgi:hypothetical protein